MHPARIHARSSLQYDNPQAQPVFLHPSYPPRAQPIELVSAASGAPVNDSVVDPVRSTAQLAERLKALGVPVTWNRYEGTSHTTLIGAFSSGLRWLAPVLDDVVAFVEGTAETR